MYIKKTSEAQIQYYRRILINDEHHKHHNNSLRCIALESYQTIMQTVSRLSETSVKGILPDLALDEIAE